MRDWEDFLLHILIQLAVIIAAARIGAWLFRKVGQPQVVGEIIAGLFLGPSVLGRIFPAAGEYLFPGDTAVVFRVLSELGLILLMFLIGLEFDFSHLRHVGRSAVSVAGAGIVLPFTLGMLLAFWLHPQLAPEANQLGFVLIVAVALSITAIPILGRIMIEFDLHRTRLGTLTITAAAIDDAVGWILLAGVSAIIHGQLQASAIVRMSLLTVLFVAGCWFLARPVLLRSFRSLLEAGHGELTVSGLACVLIVVFLSAVATNAIGIFSIFGPFIVGAGLSGDRSLREAVTRRLREIVYALFLPIFFTYTGLRTNVGLLATPYHWLLCGLLFLTATVGKTFGCGIAARLAGFSWRESGCVAVMMNTRALMGLIAINLGRDLGVIPDSAFCMLVIMALATTFITAPLLRRMLPSHPHEAPAES